ncbi:MAG: CHAT domain-containing protein [Winogradskyella sp.]|nr:MAG: CHAT domain-containing protein [Winogradskyella sp.]
MKSVFYFFLLSFLFSLNCPAQQKEKNAFNEAIIKANNKVLHGDYLEAVSLYKELLSIIKKENKVKFKSLIYNRLAETYREQGNFESAQDFAEKALKISQDRLSTNKLQEAIALDILGGIRSHEGKYDNSLGYYLRALEIKKTVNDIDSSQFATSYNNIGKAYQMKAEYSQAKDYLNMALNYISNPTPSNFIRTSSIYKIFGQINYDQSFKNEALSYYLKSLKFALKVVPDDNTTLDEIYNQIGIVYTDKGNNHEALKYLQKALSLNVKKYGVNPGQVRIHFNIGTAYTNLGMKEKALYHTNKTYNMGKKAFGESHYMMHFPYSQLGRIYGDEKGISLVKKAIELLEQNPSGQNEIIIPLYEMYLVEIYTNLNDYKKAGVHLKRALEMQKNMHDRNNSRTLKTINGLARNYFNLKDFDNALKEINNSITTNLLDNDIDILSEEKFEVTKVQDPHTFIQAILTRIEINLSKYKINNDSRLLISTYKSSKQLDNIIQKTRNSLRDYGDKLYFTSIVKKAYETHVQLCLLMQNIDSDGDYENEAFLFSEKSKSNVLRELVSNPKIKEKIDINDDLLSRDDAINNKIARVRTDIITEKSKVEADTMKTYELQEKLINLIHKKDSLEKAIEKSYPKYYKLKYENSVVDVPKIQSFLDEDTTLIDFLIAENIIFSFIINNDSYHIKRISVKDLSQKVGALNNSIVDKNQTLFQTTSESLYTELFQPIASSIKGQNVIIIPDEVLWHLQFDLLINKSKKTSVINPNYLLYDYAFSYANSASFLEETLMSSLGDEKKKDCLAFSYSNEEDENKNYDNISLERLRNSKIDLPGTRQEIKALSNIIDGTYYYGSNASEYNFKNNITDYKIIHLALHAEIDSLERDNLKILFSEINNKPNIDDNILYSHELYNMKIPSDLVVLSACNTGTGEVNKGEGIMSIGNAFQYAGAKSLLLSRWEVSDETTPKIIEEFYKNLKDGHVKSEALRLAKITHLENSGVLQSQPFYWGSFYVLGNDAAIEFGSDFNYLLFVLIGLGVLLIFYFYKKRQKS